MRQKGQALILFLVASAFAITVLSSAVVASITQGKNSLRELDSLNALSAAESGAEYAILKLMRAPSSCTGQENLTLDSASVTINYTPVGSDCLISSSATSGLSLKKVEVRGGYNSTQVFLTCCYLQLP